MPDAKRSAKTGTDQTGGDMARIECAAEAATTRSLVEELFARRDKTRPRIVETHASVVFLTHKRAWKLRKPLRLPFLDLTSLAAREHLCHEELRLNRALAGPEVYLGVVPVTRARQGALELGGTGPVIDWLVEMRRLPAESLMSSRLIDGPPPELNQVDAVVNRLLEFYATAPQPPRAGPDYVDRWLREGRINAAHLLEMQGKLGCAYDPAPALTAIELVKASRDEILSRAAQGLILEGHGDLRPEHISLNGVPILFDRMEFDPALRLVDPFEEINHLGLECAALGAPWIRSAALAKLMAVGLPRPSARLMAAYGLSRCVTRARLSLDHLRDQDACQRGRWPVQAERYLRQAKRIMIDLAAHANG